MNEKNLVKVITRGLQVDEMGAEVDELTRDRGNSILVHGLPVQQAECSSCPTCTTCPSCISCPSSPTGGVPRESGEADVRSGEN